jgi:hypothetical protein
MTLQRRAFFAILGGCMVNAEGLFAHPGHHVEGPALALADYRPRALTESEYELLDRLAETLLPSDKTGPGAHDAHVAYYIDVVLNYANATTLRSWKNGLAGVKGLSVERFRQDFGACSETQREELLTELAKNEMTPETEMDLFFVELKRAVIDGFYSSELIQREHLGYRGNTAIAEFAGCTHPNFEHPDIA